MNLHDRIAVDQQQAAEEQRLKWWTRWVENREEFIEIHYLITGRRDPWRLLTAIIERAGYWAREKRGLNC